MSFSTNTLALLCPTDMSEPRPCPIRRVKKLQTKKKSATGTTQESSVEIQVFSATPEYLTFGRLQLLGDVGIDAHRQ